MIERAVRIAIYAKGPCYVDLPADLLFAKANAKDIVYYPAVESLPKMILEDNKVKEVI